MSSDFIKQLRRIRLLLRAGRLIAALLVIAALAGALWLGFGLIDSLAAFESGARLAVTKALLAVTAIAGLVIMIRSLRVPAAVPPPTPTPPWQIPAARHPPPFP